MAIVAIKVNGREYNLACDDGQEEHLRYLADEVDRRVRELSARMGGRISDNMGLLLAAITMADELVEIKQENKNYDENSVISALNELACKIETIANN